jgi:hypothetical protein
MNAATRHNRGPYTFGAPTHPFRTPWTGWFTAWYGREAAERLERSTDHIEVLSMDDITERAERAAKVEP